MATMKVQRFVTNDFTVRAAAVDATQAVQDMQNLLKAAPLATIGVGRCMVGALLMAAGLKEGQEIGVYLKGNGSLISLYAQASFNGSVRGYCPYAHYQAPDPADVLNLKKAMGGIGSLTVSRQQPFQKQPFNGTVEMVSGEVGEDIAHYLHQSQQIRSLVALGVQLDKNGDVASAGGVLIEVMPGVEDEVINKIQENYNGIKEPFSLALKNGTSIMELMGRYLKGIPFTQIPHEHEVKYSCPCSKDRVLAALSTVGIKDLEEMIEDNKSTEIQCQMCGRMHEVSPDDMRDLKTALHRSSLH